MRRSAARPRLEHRQPVAADIRMPGLDRRLDGVERRPEDGIGAADLSRVPLGVKPVAEAQLEQQEPPVGKLGDERAATTGGELQRLGRQLPAFVLVAAMCGDHGQQGEQVGDLLVLADVTREPQALSGVRRGHGPVPRPQLRVAQPGERLRQQAEAPLARARATAAAWIR
jgi:hypothetical protein